MAGRSGKLLAHAKARGLTTTFDLIAPNQGTLAPARTISLPHIDYFMPSFEEASYLSGLTGRRCRGALSSSSAAPVPWCSSLGRRAPIRGPLPGEVFRTPAYKVDVSDTTGCGDTLMRRLHRRPRQGGRIFARPAGLARRLRRWWPPGSDRMPASSDYDQVRRFMASTETRPVTLAPNSSRRAARQCGAPLLQRRG